MNEIDFGVSQVKDRSFREASKVFKITMNIQHGFYNLCMNIKLLPTIIKEGN
jgi:hypothetical protein